MSKTSLSITWIVAIAALMAMTTLAPVEVVAHGSGHPSPIRNGQAQFTFLRPAKPARMIPIQTETGDLLVLSRFEGKVILLNFWATWCAPCVRELPALDRLQSRLGGSNFTVAALSIDEGGIDAPAAFVRRLGLKNLDVYLDFTGTTAEAFTLYGLPVTYLIDQRGYVIGYIVGTADWDAPEAVRFLSHYIEQAARD